jgi:SAM-dependent methyltransferase
MLTQHGEYSPGKEKRWGPGINFILNKIEEENKKQGSILDVGCGDGSLFRFLKKEAEERGISLNKIVFYGIDNNKIYKEVATRNGVNFILGDALNIKEYFEEKLDFVKTDQRQLNLPSDDNHCNLYRGFGTY